MLYY
jgi:hypothetical protein